MRVEMDDVRAEQPPPTAGADGGPVVAQQQRDTVAEAQHPVEREHDRQQPKPPAAVPLQRGDNLVQPICPASPI